MVRHQLPLPGARARAGNRPAAGRRQAGPRVPGGAAARHRDAAGAARPGVVPAAVQGRPSRASGRSTCSTRCWSPTSSCSGELHAAGARWVQLDEPVLAADRTPAELDALRPRLPAARVARRPAEAAGRAPTSARSATRCRCWPPARSRRSGWTSWPARATGRRSARSAASATRPWSPGVVDGRNVWRADLPAVLSLCASLLGLVGELTVSTSCSLLHVPLDLGAETSLAPELTGTARVRPAEGRRGRHARPRAARGPRRRSTGRPAGRRQRR